MSNLQPQGQCFQCKEHQELNKMTFRRDDHLICSQCAITRGIEKGIFQQSDESLDYDADEFNNGTSWSFS